MLRTSLLIAAALFALVVTAAYAGTGDDSAPREKTFLDKIVLLGGDTGGSTLHFENARIETVFGRDMFVGEQVIPDDDNKDDPSYYVTGATHYIAWERVGSLIVMPRDLVGRRVDRRNVAAKNGG